MLRKLYSCEHVYMSEHVSMLRNFVLLCVIELHTYVQMHIGWYLTMIRTCMCVGMCMWEDMWSYKEFSHMWESTYAPTYDKLKT